jgi:hypothetical protein
VAEFGIRPIADIAASRKALAACRAGRIRTRQGRLEAVYGRWWPYCGSLLGVWWDARYLTQAADCCDLYFHVPLTAPGFLSLDYARSGRRASVTTSYAALLVLDEIARLKQSQAIVCHVTNERLTDRFMRRRGWEPHCPHWTGRHFIKRFYGSYPRLAPGWRRRLGLD